MDSKHIHNSVNLPLTEQETNKRHNEGENSDYYPLRPFKFQNILLKIYYFFWWASYGMIYVFQGVYFVDIGLKIYQIFLNSALAVLFSLFFVNLWSRLSDKSSKFKKYILIGNTFRIAAFFYIIFVHSFYGMLFYMALLFAGPDPDSLLTSYIYKLSEYKKNAFMDKDENNSPIYYKIKAYTEIRKFGSIGWALFLPIGGFIINLYGFKLNFLVSASILLTINLLLAFFFDESIMDRTKIQNGESISEDNIKDLDRNNNDNDNDKEGKKDKDSKSKEGSFKNLFDSIKVLLDNRIFKVFLIAYFIYAIPMSLSSTIFSIFNSQFTSDYILLGLTWSFNAFLEYPIMKYSTKFINRFGYINTILFTYILTIIRYLLNPLLFFLNGAIYYIYLFQVINAFLFGLRWPATTYALNINAPKENKTLALTFFQTVLQFGTFLGNIFGQVISMASVLIKNGTGSFEYYLVLYISASLFVVISSLILYIKIPKKERGT